MHRSGIQDEVRERVMLRRGSVAVFDRLSPRHTAHIVVDLQNGFMDHGQMAEVPMAREIVPNVNRISAALRAAGGIVAFTQHTADAEAVRTWSGRTRASLLVDPGALGRMRWLLVASPGRPEPSWLRAAQDRRTD